MKTSGVIYVMAYWHDPRYKKKAGGLIRMYELADNLVRDGHGVVMILPKLGFPKTQTTAPVIEVPFLDRSMLRPLSFHAFSSIVLLAKLPGNVQGLYVRKMNSFLPLLIAKIFRVKSIYEIPNDPFIAYEMGGRLRGAVERWIDACSMKLADHIVVLSEWSRRRLHDLGEVPLSKIAVFPSGTDTSLFRPLSKVQCRESLGLDPSTSYVGFIGSFIHYQGIDHLITAAHSILEGHPRTRFLLVGDGPMNEQWQEMVRRQGLEKEFLFTGQVPYKQVPEFIGAMDVCVAPHHRVTNQASPVKLFDYMACARPVVASDLEVVREIAGDSGAVVLTEPDNPTDLARGVLSLLLDPEESESIGERARTHAVRHFDRQVLIRQVIGELLGGEAA